MRAIVKILFVITLLELFIGGGGRIFEMFGATLALIAEDVKPLSYFFSIVFFSYFIDNEERVHLLVSLLKKTSVYMALIYLCIQLLFYFDKIDFTQFWRYINYEVSRSDFFFRGKTGLFFYKGFVYMVLGLIFWIHSQASKKKVFVILLISSAMILSGTRGFIVMFGGLYALFYGVPLLLKLNLKIIILSIASIGASIYLFGNINLGNKDLSDSVRFKQIEEVIERVNPISFIIGHGFGNGVPIRKVHFEIGYLEVFHKQGVLGLFLWFLLIVFIHNQYKKERNFRNLRKAFYLSVLFIFFLSITNPFFNNPIGLSLLMIAISVFVVFNKIAVNSDRNTIKLENK